MSAARHCSDNADADGGGLCNLLEYTLSQNPWQPAPSPTLLTGMTTEDPTNYLVLTFPHNRHATDVTLSFEGTDTMQSWQPAAAEPVSAMVTTPDIEQLTVRIPVSSPRYFVRFRATLVSPRHESASRRQRRPPRAKRLPQAIRRVSAEALINDIACRPSAGSGPKGSPNVSGPCRSTGSGSERSRTGACRNGRQPERWLWRRPAT